MTRKGVLLPAQPRRYRMEAYSPVKGVTEEESKAGKHPEAWRWQPMDEGVAPKVWAPRATAREAAKKCWAWTLGIPAMQVVDLHTGTVVWRSCELEHRLQHEDPDPAWDPGPPITPEWDAEMREEVRAEYAAEAAEETAQAPRAAPERPTPPTAQPALF